MGHIRHVTPYFLRHIYIYIYIYIYYFVKNISVTCVSCTILLKKLELLKHSSTILYYRSLHLSHGNAQESLPCGFGLSKNFFAYMLHLPVIYFQVSHSMRSLSEVKQNLKDLFSLPFSAHQQSQRTRFHFWYYFQQ